MRLLVLCTHNSARSQMAEGWLRYYAKEFSLEAEVFSAGTERTKVKADAVTVMAEVGVDLRGHHSKTLDELPDPWNFDLIMTVCDSANEACPSYPAATRRLHLAFPDPSGAPLERWREVRDRIGEMSRTFVWALVQGRTPSEAELTGTPT
jgi:arsenate reductase